MSLSDSHPSFDTCLIVGLGNPGDEYKMTRHNLGFMVVQSFAEKCGLILKKEKAFKAETARGVVKDKKVHLLNPHTFMNVSGQAVRRYMDYYQLGVENVIVVSDDVELPFGRMRLREKGSAGGHNGLKSIEQFLGTNVYLRLKMGIGKVPKTAMTSHVLGSFSKDEKDLLESFIERGVTCLERLLLEDINKVMNDVNIRGEDVSS